MSISHTPGPWSPGHMANNAHPCNCATIFSEKCLGGVATVHVGNGMPISDGGNDCPLLPEAQANARLIAAAPELLDALREAKALADMAVMSDDQDGTPSDDQGALVRLRTKIDAAISKATSRQPEGER